MYKMSNKIRRIINRLTKTNSDLKNKNIELDSKNVDLRNIREELLDEITVLKQTNKNILRDLVIAESTAKAQSGMLMFIFMYWFLKLFY